MMMSNPPSILISDDDPGLRETLGDLFLPRGYRTFLASDGEEALSIALREQVHVVVTDLEMPRLTGIEVIRRVHRHRQSLPCILVSASDSLPTEEADCNHFFSILCKPFSCQEIRGTVERALRLTYNWDFSD
ncbi:Sensor histidine kinase RcsC [Planctomycetales bacterium 10988]|nr:Sensor histidine kinase RcsC [Planctomycetales bacterium 10988]